MNNHNLFYEINRIYGRTVVVVVVVVVVLVVNLYLNLVKNLQLYL